MKYGTRRDNVRMACDGFRVFFFLVTLNKINFKAPPQNAQRANRPSLVDKEAILFQILRVTPLSPVLKSRAFEPGNIRGSLWIFSSHHDVILDLLHLMSYVTQQRRHIEFNLGVVLCSTINGCFSDVVSTNIVAQQHVKRCGGTAFFLVTLYAHLV